MSNASELKQCPQCGGPISTEAPQGLCPKCLLRQVSFGTETGHDAETKATPPALEEVAAAFPHLEILELIGQGGMGFVFKARQPKLDRLVALKILPQSLAADSAFAMRFTREGRVLARLNHPNIVAIHDFGQANGFFYLLMEYVDGVNLRQAMKAGRFTPAQALAIVPKICEALQVAHGEGILHRDIKPENILLDTRGRVKIADFGIAKLVAPEKLDPLANRQEADSSSSRNTGDAVAPALTSAGRVLGTPHYMAPEQLERPQEVDHRADIYSLGVVFYEMLTGELPRGRFVPPSEKSTVDPRVDEVVLRALQKAPERRQQSAEEVKTRVETIANGGVTAPENTWAQIQSRPAPSRRTQQVVLSLGMALCFVVGAFLLVHFLPRKPRPTGPNPAKTDVVAYTLESTSGASGNDTVASEKPARDNFSKTFTFGRAANKLIGEYTNAWALGLWTETGLEPGEALQAQNQIDDGPVESRAGNTLRFENWSPDRIGTSVALSWYFGATWGDDFAEPEAEAALAQLADKMFNNPLTLTNGQPFELFAVTNKAGKVRRGFVEFTRTLPKPPPDVAATAALPQAIVNVRRFAAYIPSLDYSVKLPPGYALHATGNGGQVSTHISAPSPFGNYHSSWHLLPQFARPGSLPSPGDFRDFPAQLQAQRSALEVRFQDLQDMGPIPVVLGNPFPLFSITNKAGDVFSGFLELVSPSSASEATAPKSAVAPAKKTSAADSSQPVRTAAAPVIGASSPGFSPDLPNPPVWNPAANSASSAKIDPGTGLPLVPGTDPHLKVDPATGLLVPASTPTRTQRTIIPSKPH